MKALILVLLVLSCACSKPIDLTVKASLPQGLNQVPASSPKPSPVPEKKSVSPAPSKTALKPS